MFGFCYTKYGGIMKIIKKYSEMHNFDRTEPENKPNTVSKEFSKILEQESEFDFQAIEYREKIGLLINKIVKQNRA
jgi:hypothetical protein